MSGTVLAYNYFFRRRPARPKRPEAMRSNEVGAGTELRFNGLKNTFIAAAYWQCSGWCMVTPGTTILTSPDGIAWTEESFVPGGDISALVRGNDKFVAAGFGGAGGYGATYTSSDGITWLEQSCSTCGFGNLLHGIAYGNNTYVAVGDKGILLVSSDGISWSDSTAYILRRDGRLNDITYGSAGFVAVGGGWVSSASYTDLDPMAEGYVPVINSASGTAWTARHSGIAFSTLNTVAFGNNTYVAVGREGIIITSTDGVTWTPRASGTNLEINVVAYGNGIFVAVGNGRISLTSSNGIDWTKTTSENIDIPDYMVYGGGLFVAVGYNGMIITSPDGITWTKRDSGTSRWLRCISYGNNTFVAVGSSGTILTSPDGVEWSTRSSGTTNDLNGIAYGNSTFAVTGYAGTVLSSFDGKAWIVKSPVTDAALGKITFGNDSFVVIGDNANVLQCPRDDTPDPFTFAAQTDAALSTVITSNAITASGIYSATSISITGGTYSVNGGPYTSATSKVNTGDTITVRLVSSESYSATTNATLNIGGLSETFSVTTLVAVPGDGGGGGGSDGGGSDGGGSDGGGSDGGGGADGGAGGGADGGADGAAGAAAGGGGGCTIAGGTHDATLSLLVMVAAALLTAMRRRGKGRRLDSFYICDDGNDDGVSTD